ncbi:hypothetical protein AXF42_Ash001373 [Apostasia shenzhenica]|uniref:RPA-interacting protein A n=1 Tax=Apostasia shenzhenica TaxID=1088818 RepID=A0A2I0AUQ6_9ASPA|nr:hypothetical protein AXF42_Ash001373 [Apostasia shenzhenica]
MHESKTRRENPKTHRCNWKHKLRQNCLRRVQEERAQLLWKIRSNGRRDSHKKEVVESTFRDIVSDEFEKIKQSALGICHEISNSKNDDSLWEYDSMSSEIQSEDIMIEMERVLYRDLREEKIRRELEFIEEEDEYLAQVVFEHMQINDDQDLKNRIWCPICKRGELKETHNLIYCTGCSLQLDLENDKVDLQFLKARLGEVHVGHLDRGCKATPEFCVETVFDLTALYSPVRPGGRPTISPRRPPNGFPRRMRCPGLRDASLFLS